MEIYENYKKNSLFDVKSLYVSSQLGNRDIIRLEAAGPFFSERIINAFKKENIIGYKIIEGGDYKIELNFSDE